MQPYFDAEDAPERDLRSQTRPLSLYRRLAIRSPAHPATRGWVAPESAKAATARKRPSSMLQKVKRAVSCIVRAVADVSWPKLAEPRVVTNVPKLV